MKKLIILLALTSSVFAKFPNENDYTIGIKNNKEIKNVKGIKGIVSKADLLKGANKIDEEVEFDLTEGKIQAAMFVMRQARVEEAKQSVLELLMRVSTVEKLNVDRANPIETEEFVLKAQAIMERLEVAIEAEMSIRELNSIELEVENLAVELEEIVNQL